MQMQSDAVVVFERQPMVSEIAVCCGYDVWRETFFSDCLGDYHGPLILEWEYAVDNPLSADNLEMLGGGI